MNQFKPVYIAAMLLCAMGAWGCSQQKTGTISAKINELETRYGKLEEDYRTLQATHELHRKKLANLETKRAELEKDRADLNDQVVTISAERDSLRRQVNERTQERDVAQGNLMQFTKDLQALVGRVEATMNQPAPTPSASIIPASRRTE